MTPERIRLLLEQFQRGQITLEETEQAIIGTAKVADLGFAQLDLDRNRRCGFPEVVFGQGKTPEQMLAIVERLSQEGHGCLATRVETPAAARLQAHFPNAQFDEISRVFWLPGDALACSGSVAVVSAGTSDLPVAREAYLTAQAMGCRVELIVDVGVAGLHRILSKRSLLEEQDAIVVVAGMEGALPSVVGGLTSCPVIAVPTSIGYGASFHGLAALLGMLSSCAANVAVVNIDAGFCGGYVAALIARQRNP
jgi:hypothetical protein